MHKKEIKALLERYQAGTCTPAQRRQVEAWMQELQQLPLEVEERELEEDLAIVWNQLHQNAQKSTRFWLSPKLWRGVAAVLCIGFAAYATYQGLQKPEQSEVHNTKVLSDIPPGGNKALLTLGDGRVVALQDLQVGADMQQEGVVLKKLGDGELIYETRQGDLVAKESTYNTIRTPKGGQFKVILPDGSKVWLNASSSLRYPTRFAASDRRVELEGEAYFEVETKKDQGIKQPFIVRSKSQEVEVLGTHFNINDYEDESQSATTLLEGSVKVTRVFNGEKTQEFSMLKPGEQSLVSADKMEVLPAKVQYAVAWKDGYFHFDRADLKSVMRQFARWYNIEVEYQTDRYGDEFMGDIPRNANLSKALRILKLGGVRFKQEGRNVIITE